ncbi:MAG: beta-ketoacyl-ACP synthase III [Coriobacteriia bacterium]|nr:beta-ketoacyl-ACP synthase III [Coriobacteriia bacterium]
MTHAAVIGVGSYLPEHVLTNADLARMVETSDEWIVTRTGIRERRMVGPDEMTSDLAARAGERALADANIAPEKVDLLVVGTSTPDMAFPSTACLTQAKLGLTCPAYDLNAACTGFIFALQHATAAIESGRAKTVLVIGADALTRLVDFTDRSTCVLFGDGAGAFVLQASKEQGVLGVHLGSDGHGADLLYAQTTAPVPADAFLKMNGNEVFKFAVRAIPKVTRQALRESHLTVDDVTWFVPHQANQRILDTIADRLGVPHERVVSTIERTGNTSSASIPLAIDGLYTAGNLKSGDILVLVGFGAGLTWGAAVVRWTKKEIS